MIIACPACATRYVVPDTAVGAEGRTVRCAKCRHSWFQEPEAALGEAAAPAPAEPAPPPPPAARPEPARFVTPEPTSEPEPVPPVTTAPVPVEQPAVQEPQPAVTESGTEPPLASPYRAASDSRAEPVQQSAEFEDAAPRRRRSPLRLLTWAAVIFALLAAGLVAAVSYWGLPNWVPISHPAFASAPAELRLDFPAAAQERRQLPNGTEYFGASGSITNTGATTQTVPPILIVMRDARDRIVYTWEVQPPKRSLAPGETITVNEAVTDVPRSAKFAEIGWKPS